MRRHTVLYQLYIFSVSLLVLTIGILTLVFIQNSRTFYYSEQRAELENTTVLFRNLMEARGFPESPEDLAIYNEFVTRDTPSRISLITPSGIVVADSEGDIYLMSNHASRPEVKAALEGNTGFSMRYSATVSRDMMYVAMPVYNGGDLAGVVRLSYPGDSIKARIKSIYRKTLLISVLILFLAVWLSFILARRFSRVVNGIKEAADHYSREDFSLKLKIDRPEELKLLGEALNTMGQQLRERLDTIRAQKHELQAILDSMTEPVIFMDLNMRVRKLNAAAFKIFSIRKDWEGRNILEVFRNTRLYDFGKESADSLTGGSRELTLEALGQFRTMQVHATPLQDPEKTVDGLLFVMHDITQAKKLEIMRKDFVASVSHELKTPITNIKGYVETILENPGMAPDQSLDFLSIIARHTDRLTSIIDDLLTLSEIEKTESQELKKELCLLPDLLASVIQVCSPGAAKKDIRLELQCPRQLEVRVHPLLAEQAVLNLVDNAVKYSGKGTRVIIRAGMMDEDPGRVKIEVEDQGPGIGSEDLERIFERFYRVDKARSRDAGGTGLGLSIVKHIALAHGGQVEASSVEGRGSLFRIIF